MPITKSTGRSGSIPGNVGGAKKKLRKKTADPKPTRLAAISQAAGEQGSGRRAQGESSMQRSSGRRQDPSEFGADRGGPDVQVYEHESRGAVAGEEEGEGEPDD